MSEFLDILTKEPVDDGQTREIEIPPEIEVFKITLDDALLQIFTDPNEQTGKILIRQTNSEEAVSAEEQPFVVNNGKTLEIFQKTRNQEYTSTNVQLRLPPEKSGNFEISVQTGCVFIHNTKGFLEATLGRGSIQINNHMGNLDIKNYLGGIELRNITAFEMVKVYSKRGSIRWPIKEPNKYNILTNPRRRQKHKKGKMPLIILQVEDANQINIYDH